MQVLNPNNVPHTNARFVIITEGELQRLRTINAEVIAATHDLANKMKQGAKMLKAAGEKELSSQAYDMQRKLLTKATALGKSQYALKHNALTNAEVVEYFNAAGISMVQTASLYGIHGRSEAWYAVTNVLEEVAPGFMSKQGTGFMSKQGTGIDCTLQAIRDLAAGTYKQPV